MFGWGKEMVDLLVTLLVCLLYPGSRSCPCRPPCLPYHDTPALHTTTPHKPLAPLTAFARQSNKPSSGSPCRRGRLQTHRFQEGDCHLQAEGRISVETARNLLQNSEKIRFCCVVILSVAFCYSCPCQGIADSYTSPAL